MNITREKERFMIVIKLSLRKRQVDYKMSNWLRILETKIALKKKKKKKKLATLKSTFLLKIFLWLGP